jgi:phosphatidate cytidylyltransferase
VSELGKRFTVAGVGIPVFLGLSYLGGWFLALPLSAFAGWATHEIYRLAHQRNIEPIEWVGVPAATVLVLLGGWLPSFTAFAPWALAVIGATTMIALVASMLTRGPGGNPLAASGITVVATVYVGLALACAPLLHALPAAAGWVAPEGAALGGLAAVALPLFATWIGDAAALFAGTAWGKRKLAPTISPNKSWVGFWGDVIGAAFGGVLWFVVLGPKLPNAPLGGVWVLATLGALLGATAVLGDLIESLLKREAGVKDSGTFFPGHGGVMDRVDSLLFTFPAAYCLLLILGWMS